MMKTPVFSGFRFRLESPPAFQATHRQLGLASLAASCALSVSASHYDGSRTTPVHRIPLLDEEGQAIIPTVAGSMPFSARTTCGACHDYDAIHGGTHFGGAGQGRATEPWIAVDEPTGTQVPADRLHLSAWDFTRRFGRHLPGGGGGDPADKLADPAARWDVSGGLEINCLACHNLSPRQDLAEWARQMGRENFRWAATAASGLGEVGGMASRLPDWWNIHTGANPDDTAWAVPPSVDYDTALFDPKHRIWFDIGRPRDNNCLQCHSVHPAGAQRMDVPGDVHAAAGLSCTDCHRNGIDHQMLRGTTAAMGCAACHDESGEAAGRLGAPIARHKGLPPIHFEKMACTACHSGPLPGAAPQPVRTSRANRLGIHGRALWATDAPFIVEPVFVRNGDGQIEPRRMMWPSYWAYLDGRPLDDDLVAEAAVGVLDAGQQVGRILAGLATVPDAPGEPLYATGGRLYRRNVDGGLNRAGCMPAGDAFVWASETNLVSSVPDFDVHAEPIDPGAEEAILGFMEALKPLDAVLAAGGRLFTVGPTGYLSATNTAWETGWYRADGGPLVPPPVERAVADTAGTALAFNEEQVALMLRKLGPTTCYIAGGRRFSLDGDGRLVDEDHAAAGPVSWPLAHDVRGAAQSLGARGCTDCHAPDTGFLFGAVAATGPLLTDRAAVFPMHAFQGLDAAYNRLFGLTFQVRSGFKAALAAAAVLLGLLALAFALPALHRLAGSQAVARLPRKPVLAALAGSAAVLAITGFGFGWPLDYPLDGFPLLTHVGFGALYAAALLAWALLRAKTGGFWFWLLEGCGIVLVLSVLLAMFPVLGTRGQHIAVVVHRVAALASILAAGMGCLAARKGDRHE